MAYTLNDVPPVWSTADDDFLLRDSPTEGDSADETLEPSLEIEEPVEEGNSRPFFSFWVDIRRSGGTDQSKHFFYIRWICRRPKTMFCIALLGHIAFVLISLVLYLKDYNILPVMLDDMPAFNMYDVIYRRELAWREREFTFPVFLFDTQYPKKRKRRSIADHDVPLKRYKRSERHVYKERLHLLYETINGDNVFTPERLAAIKKFEEQFDANFNQTGKHSNDWHWYCGATSVLDIFEKDFSRIRPSYANDKAKTWLMIGVNGSVDPKTGKADSKITRTFLNLCFVDDFPKLISWELDDVIPWLVKEEAKVLNPVGVKMNYWSYRAYSGRVFRQATDDFKLFAGSILFIFVFMWMQTSSLWITTFGTLSILTSFIGANLFYNCVIGYKFLSIFNLMALFVVLGIGADDIFVFTDTWKSMRDIEDMEERMSKCFRRAGAAMFTTSLTTMVAFFVSSFSKLLPISSFGSFAGLTVFVNYVSVIVFFPTVVAVHHRHFERPCCHKCVSDSPGTSDVSQRIFDKVSAFFGGSFYEIVTHRINKWICLSAFALLVTGMVISITDIRMDERMFIKAFKNKNMFETSLLKTAFDYKLGVNDKMVQVHMVWGLNPRDMDRCNRLTYTRFKPCAGDPDMDDTFSLEKPESQLAMLNFCNNLTNLHGASRDHLMLDHDDKNRTKIVCFIQYLDSFLRNNMSALLGHKVALPLTKAKLRPIIPLLKLGGLEIDLDKITNTFQTFLAIFVEQYGTDLKKMLGFTKTNASEIVGEYKDQEEAFSGEGCVFPFLYHGKSYNSCTPVDTKEYKPWCATTPNFDEAPRQWKYCKDKYFYNMKLKYAAVVAPLSVQEIRVTVDKGLTLMNRWDDYMKEQTSLLPPGLQNGWQFATNWMLSRQKHTLMRRALIGICISLGLAFVVLLLTTRNLILAILAEITLVAAVICVIGVLPLADWQFGVMESINVCFVAGLAVDYIVHMVEAYNMSEYKSRHERTQDALRRIGISVLSGALTTLGASFFMFFADILLFMQFGVFIFCTVGFSLIFALFFFPAILSICGPSGDVGSFPWMYRGIKNVFLR